MSPSIFLDELSIFFKYLCKNALFSHSRHTLNASEGRMNFFASIMQVWKDMGEIGLEKDIYLTFFNGV